jgi:hypothetical protein
MKIGDLTRNSSTQFLVRCVVFLPGVVAYYTRWTAVQYLNIRPSTSTQRVYNEDLIALLLSSWYGGVLTVLPALTEGKVTNVQAYGARSTTNIDC